MQLCQRAVAAVYNTHDTVLLRALSSSLLRADLSVFLSDSHSRHLSSIIHMTQAALKQEKIYRSLIGLHAELSRYDDVHISI